jgi:two-component system phosphate regulon sensor histidine kinase PhoR
VWTDIKQNFYSLLPFFREFLLFYIIVVVIIMLSGHGSVFTIYYVFFFTIASVYLLNMLGARKRNEINKIKQIIDDIRNNNFEKPEEIKLPGYLSELQDDIQLMFDKSRGDIEYLNKLERMRSEFLANVSHELRTPIFTIQGYLETLIDGAINDAKVNMNFLVKANQHTINLNHLLNDLIDISMIETGEMRMSFRYFHISEYLRELYNELLPMAEEKNLEFIYYPPRGGLQLFGDKNRLRQVMINLITNAIKYTEKGKVEILIEEEERFGRIIVRDTGLGIPEEDLDRIFERFYRVDKARSRGAGGTGLGLAIAKHIIEAHNSKIEVISKIDQGTEFSFRLKK